MLLGNSLCRKAVRSAPLSTASRTAIVLRRAMWASGSERVSERVAKRIGEGNLERGGESGIARTALPARARYILPGAAALLSGAAFLGIVGFLAVAIASLLAWGLTGAAFEVIFHHFQNQILWAGVGGAILLGAAVAGGWLPTFALLSRKPLEVLRGE
jgi:hypothetical protein